MYQSYTSRLTELWSLPKPAQGLNTYNNKIFYLYHNWRNISTIYIYITRLASNETFSPANKINREVGRAKNLSAPRFIRSSLRTFHCLPLFLQKLSSAVRPQLPSHCPFLNVQNINFTPVQKCRKNCGFVWFIVMSVASIHDQPL